MRSLHFFILLWMVQLDFGDDCSSRRDLPFLKLAECDGYTAEQHYVTTKDGYILCLHRIPPNKNCTNVKGVILFVHGLYLSSDDCIVPGPGYAHCYIYADNCYDVWALNVRGNVYSRNHTSYNPDKDPEYWDFSFDEMAVCDLPAIIDYILIVTGSNQIFYVAHSQGVTILLILCAKIPEYNAKIKVAFGLSATAWLDHSTFFVVQVQGALAPLLAQTPGLLAEEILSRGGLAQRSAELLCGMSNASYPICSYCIFVMFGYNEYQITSEILPVVVGHTPSGTSFKNFIRWGKVYHDGFREYDYGTIKNLEVYGQATPPEYNLSQVTVRWIFLNGPIDNVGTVPDVKFLVSKLPNASFCELSTDKFTHLDYVYGCKIPVYITPIVLSTIETGSYMCT